MHIFQYKPFSGLILLVLLCLPTITKSDGRSDSFDVIHYDINLDISDIPGKSIAGFTSVSLKAKVNNLQNITLELYKLEVDSVSSPGRDISFTYNDSVVRIFLMIPLGKDDSLPIVIFYHGQPKKDPSGWGGFYFGSTNGGYVFNLGVGFKVNPHNFGRAWFPCVDNFIDRATYSYNIATIATHKAFCGGLLLDSVQGLDGKIIWKWHQSSPIPPYLASVAVADYSTWNQLLTGDERSIPTSIGMWEIDAQATKNAFQHLEEGLVAFEHRYGPYQFERIGFTLVPFEGGAMEHAGNIAFPRSSVYTGLGSEGLWSHEFAHHWWGNLVTCRTAEDMWLNEGWATYSEKLFFEIMYGREAYKADVLKNHTFVLRYAHLYDDGYRAISPVPHEYTYGRHVYNKGADAAHTLRSYLGDSLFFGGIQAFLAQYAFADISTTDLLNFLSQYSGIDLTAFFDDWVYKPGFPHFSLKDVLIYEDTSLHVSGIIEQRLHHSPSYYSNVPMELTIFGQSGLRQTFQILCSGETTEFNVLCDFEPVYVGLDIEAKISDATSSSYVTIKTTGNYNFIDSLLRINVTSIVDSAWINVEQHWLGPLNDNDPTGLIVSADRYFTIGGILPGNLQAAAVFYYDGTALTSGSGGFLDQQLLANIGTPGNYTENDLIVLYRPDPLSPWEIADATFNTGNIKDKKGTVAILNLKKGDYVLALGWPVGISKKKTINNDVKVFPNPTEDEVVVQFSRNLDVQQIELADLSGRVIYTHILKDRTKTFTLSMASYPAGEYILKVTTSQAQVSSKIIKK
ncbi:MAG: T9SS type A sorting domain-containing protein [Bacteroidota bacterium]|nr:T9SS type A sorting domain-containing protein [Bacteroidota bacterium]